MGSIKQHPNFHRPKFGEWKTFGPKFGGEEPESPNRIQRRENGQPAFFFGSSLLSVKVKGLAYQKFE